MKLALFFTRNVSLKLWLDSGLFDREKLIYEEHLRSGFLQKVYWLTYGKDDVSIAERLKSENRLHPDIVVLPMPVFFLGFPGRLLYSFFMPFVHSDLLKSVDVLKTNQVNGSWAAVIAKWLYTKPLIARAGYILSFFARKKARPKLKIKIIECVERFAYKYADVIVVASQRDKEYICSKHNILVEKIKVLPNYINTNAFSRQNCKKYEDKIIFVGRLTPQKNLFELIEAVSNTDFTLDIYGQGELYSQLKHRAERLSASVNFMSVVANHKLPEVLNRYHYYILPSLYEGTPKTLLEAMACGLVCIGTDVEGISDIIEDGVNGFLAEATTAKAITDAIIRATQLSTESVSAKAVRKAQEEFSIETIVKQEQELIGALKL